MRIFSIILVLSVLSFSSFAQFGGGDPAKVELDSAKKIKWAAIPVPTWDQITGWGVVGVVMGYYKPNRLDTISPTSSFGVVGMYSQNKNFFVGGWNQMYLKEDLWRLTLAGGSGDYNFQFLDRIMDPPTFIKFGTKYSFIYAAATYNVWDRLYVGGHWVSYAADTEYQIDPPFTGRSKMHAPGLNVTYDSRDDVNFPMSGWQVNLTSNHYLKKLNEPALSFDNWTIDVNKYISVRKNKDVVALRAMTSFSTGDVPFEAQEVIGNTDIPGYTEGRYRGDVKIAAQSEYRLHLYKKWRLVGLLAAASVTDEDGKFTQLLPAAGAGIRYKFMKDEKSHIGLDFVRGKDDWQLVVRFGESF
ncbi:BamA/TamA family outer membrane protein [Reichenbachiella sp.]|uniref:BamA/TamA family outer membrane protein n=1 Tax=Reichenbachiella sp. TaxID=2184521 RepID=UPI003B5B3FD7